MENFKNNKIEINYNKNINSQIKELEKIWLPEDFTRDT